MPGDLVILELGNKIPADIRLLKATDCRVNEMPLTGSRACYCSPDDCAGESEPVRKVAEMAHAEEAKVRLPGAESLDLSIDFSLIF